MKNTKCLFVTGMLCSMASCLAGCSSAPPPTAAAPGSGELLLDLLDQESEAVRQFRLAGRGPDFSPTVVKETYKELPEPIRICSGAILEAQLGAMRETANDAARSFRNCADEASRKYLHDELAAFGQSVEAGRHDEATRHLGAAMAALHAFYAHTNFVDLLAATMDWSQVSGIAFEVWREGPLAVDQSIRSALKSDHRESAHPKQCKPPPPQLDKSSKRHPWGQVRLTRWGLTAHEAAVALALADSGAMLKSAWKRYPAYAEACGQKGSAASAVVAFLHAIFGE